MEVHPVEQQYVNFLCRNEYSQNYSSKVPPQACKEIIVLYVAFSIILGDHVENDPGNEHQKTRKYEQYGSDQCGDAGHQTSVPELNHDRAKKTKADQTNDGS